MSKEFKTHEELLTLLRGRGVAIDKGSAESRVKRILERENYYNVINGYKGPFIDRIASTPTDEKYKTNTDFEEIHLLYTFDREIRMIYLKYIFKIENNFKAVLSHVFSEKYGHDNYLKLANFDNAITNDIKTLKKIADRNKLDISTQRAEVEKVYLTEAVSSITKLIGDIQQEVARQLSKNNEMVSHYMTTHGYIPLWVLVNVLTFGKVTNFYFNMKEVDRVAVARQFKLQPPELHKYMTMLGIARNKCAHDERFYDIRTRQSLHTKSIPYFSKIGLPTDKSGSPIMGTNDAFAVAIIFKQLLSKNDFEEFASSMDIEFGKLSKGLKTITTTDVQKIMGYPVNWMDIKNY